MTKMIRFFAALLCTFLICATAVAAEGLTVGVSIPLTGGLAEYGVAVRNGLQLAREEQPEILKNIRIVIEDDKYDPKMTVSVVNRMIDLEHADLMFIWGNEPALGAAPVVERRKLPTFVVAQHPKAGAGYKFVVRFINPASEYSAAIVEYLRAHHLKKFGVLKTEISFFNILLEEFAKVLAPDESMTIVQNFLPGESDFRSVVTKLKQEKFDAIGVYLLPAQVGQFYRQAAEQEYHPKTFGTTTFESGTVIKNSLGLMNGAVYSHIDVDPAFKSRYVKRFGDDVEIAYAANAYDFILLTGKLFGAASQPPSAEEILERYVKSPPEAGASGLRTFKASEEAGRYFDFPVVVKRIEGDKIVTE